MVRTERHSRSSHPDNRESPELPLPGNSFVAFLEDNKEPLKALSKVVKFHAHATAASKSRIHAQILDILHPHHPLSAEYPFIITTPKDSPFLVEVDMETTIQTLKDTLLGESYARLLNNNKNPELDPAIIAPHDVRDQNAWTDIQNAITEGRQRCAPLVKELQKHNEIAVQLFAEYVDRKGIQAFWDFQEFLDSDDIRLAPLKTAAEPFFVALARNYKAVYNAQSTNLREAQKKARQEAFTLDTSNPFVGEFVEYTVRKNTVRIDEKTSIIFGKRFLASEKDALLNHFNSTVHQWALPLQQEYKNYVGQQLSLRLPVVTGLIGLSLRRYRAERKDEIDPKTTFKHPLPYLVVNTKRMTWGDNEASVDPIEYEILTALAEGPVSLRELSNQIFTSPTIKEHSKLFRAMENLRIALGEDMIERLDTEDDTMYLINTFPSVME